ncbi:MAG: LamG domain-containing protein [Haliscomenobacter sp.]|uniref:LamG domain-containing protein n=1 Tax=Haliscomenobacter sp. TaxID=2717303 RepID=UPI0029A9FF01|nr:LamG domain-containing protein [Haliscomenobacter sp.]MDX2070766.1 LamG domain-containing protein [Haliscomenobacter sp.]
MKKFLLAFCLYFIALGASLAQVHNGDLNLYTQTEVDAFNYSEVNGNLFISGANVTNLNKLTSLKKVKSLSVNATKIVNFQGLQNLKTVDNYVYIQSNNDLTSLIGLSGLNTCGGRFFITKNPLLTDAAGLSKLTTIGGVLFISENNSLTTIGMSALTSIGSAEITLNNNLKSLNDLFSLQQVSERFYVSQSPALTDLSAIRPLVATGSVGNIQIHVKSGSYNSKADFLKAYPTTPNNALTFDGVDDVIELGVPTFYKNSFTIEGWIKPMGAGAIFNVYQNENSAIYAEVTMYNTFRFLVRNPPAKSGGADIIGKVNVVTDGKWHHFAAVKGDDDYLQLYIDGKLEGKSPYLTGDFASTPYKMRLGMDQPHSPRYYKGSMDEIRFWNVARSQQDILANKDKTLTGNEPGLSNYYKFNQGTANGDNKTMTTLSDSKSVLNGTLQKFQLSGSSSNFTSGAPVQ